MIAPGSRLGPYEVLGHLGSGGMGEVYNARDSRLGRAVAIKVLPRHLASSPETRQRFEREARTISQLSHPHICAVHDVGSEGETEYLVMELLEGETLAQRLAKGALPLSDTLRFGAQIASALDAAHRKGIVHRDLKPSNIMLTRSGVKLLDFGLAKVLAPVSTMESLTSAETAAPDVTRPGMVLGTVPYMAPEQLEGKDPDSRGDIFALGAVLYEMAAGRKAFDGASPVSIMSAIMTSEPPPVSSLQAAAPPSLDRLVRTCLAKDPHDRWQTARDVELQLAAIAEGGSVSREAPALRRRAPTRWLPWLIAAAALAVAAAAVWRGAASRPPPGRPVRFFLPPPKGGEFSYWVETCFLAVSPDGSQLAYVASEPPGPPRVYVRPLSALEGRPVPGTEGASSLFFSPDGRSIAFLAEGKLKRVDLAGGAAVSICDAPFGRGFVGTWGRGGEILLSGGPEKEILRVRAAGGVPAIALRIDPSRDEARVAWPWFLPDGESFLYFSKTRGGVGSLMLARPGRPPQVLMPIDSAAQYADPGYVVFAKEGVLVAAPFDWRAGRVTGGPTPIAERVRYFLSTGSAAFAVSAGGTIAYQPEGDTHRLAWFDRSGRQIGTVGTPGQYLTATIDPEGRRVVFDRTRPDLGTYDVWYLDLERGIETRVTSDRNSDFSPRFLPGGKSIVYSKPPTGAPQMFRRDLATGKEEEMAPSGKFQMAEAVSPDGKSLLYSQRGDQGWEVWTLPLSGGGKPALLLRSSFSIEQPRISPDGRSLAMITNESGQPEAYVTSYPDPGERIRISTGGAQRARWSPDGREIFFLSGDGRLMSAPVAATSPPQVGAPRELFTLSGSGKVRWQDFDVSPDGRKFLAIVPEVLGNERPLTVVTNWSSEMAK